MSCYTYQPRPIIIECWKERVGLPQPAEIADMQYQMADVIRHDDDVVAILIGNKSMLSELAK